MTISDDERLTLIAWLKSLNTVPTQSRQDQIEPSSQILTDQEWDELSQISAADFVRVAVDVTQA